LIVCPHTHRANTAAASARGMFSTTTITVGTRMARSRRGEAMPRGSGFRGNAYTAHGRQREPEIAAFMESVVMPWARVALGRIKGGPEQVTPGPTEEEGIAMAPDGRSFVTAVTLSNVAVASLCAPIDVVPPICCVLIS